MRAGYAFRQELRARSWLDQVTRYECRLHGSLAATGVGHGTPDALIAGLQGHEPETVDPANVRGIWPRIAAGEAVLVDQVAIRRHDVLFEPRARHLGHPNALTLTAANHKGPLLEQTYLSVGGGFIQTLGEPERATRRAPASAYRTASQLLALCQSSRTIADIAWDDETTMHGPVAAARGLDAIWAAMRDCVERGLATDGVLPGTLRVRRRAAAAAHQLQLRGVVGSTQERLALHAMAVNEENAAGGRVVTAPTNGAAGIIPAVLYDKVCSDQIDRVAIHTFLLTAAAVGSIIKANASISGAEAGCQAEVGSACAMAAAGLTAIEGGTPRQIENAAEIALEHHLGLSCDPVGGLVQIPCIERNAVAAATAVTATRLALLGDGSHIVSLDTAIETMRQTGADMSHRYKETSTGGLAVNVVEC